MSQASNITKSADFITISKKQPKTEGITKIFPAELIQLLRLMRKNVMHGGEMRISCPNCHAVYDVPEDRLEPASSLRCSECHYSWPLGGIASKTSVLKQAEPRTNTQKTSLLKSGSPKRTPDSEAPTPPPSPSPSLAASAAPRDEARAKPKNPTQQPSGFSAKIARAAKPDSEPEISSRETGPGLLTLPARLTGASDYEAIQAAYTQQDDPTEEDEQEQSLPLHKRRLDLLLWVTLLFLLILPLVVLARHEILKLIRL